MNFPKWGLHIWGLTVKQLTTRFNGETVHCEADTCTGVLIQLVLPDANRFQNVCSKIKKINLFQKFKHLPYLLFYTN